MARHGSNHNRRCEIFTHRSSIINSTLSLRRNFADADGFGFTIDAGDPVINSPENQLSLQLTKDFSVGDKPARFGAGYLYVGERNGWVGSDFQLPNYTTIRLFGEIEPVDGLSVQC